MPNHNPKTEHLYKNYSKWQNKDTVLIRVPKSLKDEILAFAKELDSQRPPDKTK